MPERYQSGFLVDEIRVLNICLVVTKVMHCGDSLCGVGEANRKLTDQRGSDAGNCRGPGGFSGFGFVGTVAWRPAFPGGFASNSMACAGVGQPMVNTREKTRQTGP